MKKWEYAALVCTGAVAVGFFATSFYGLSRLIEGSYQNYHAQQLSNSPNNIENIIGNNLSVKPKPTRDKLKSSTNHPIATSEQNTTYTNLQKFTGKSYDSLMGLSPDKINGLLISLLYYGNCAQTQEDIPSNEEEEVYMPVCRLRHFDANDDSFLRDYMGLYKNSVIEEISKHTANNLMNDFPIMLTAVRIKKYVSDELRREIHEFGMNAFEAALNKLDNVEVSEFLRNIDNYAGQYSACLGILDIEKDDSGNKYRNKKTIEILERLEEKLELLAIAPNGEIDPSITSTIKSYFTYLPSALASNNPNITKTDLDTVSTTNRDILRH